MTEATFVKDMGNKVEFAKPSETSEKYFEKVLDLRVDGLEKVAQWLEKDIFDTYFLYEKEEEISFGVEYHTCIEVTTDKIFVTTGEERKMHTYDDLSATLSEIFNDLEIKNWRAYGIANYSLARFNYGLPVQPESEKLLEMSIPKKEIRFYENQVLLRAMDENALDELEELLKAPYKDNSEHLEEKLSEKTMSFEGVQTVFENYYKDIVTQAVGEIRENLYQKVVLSRKIEVPYQLNMPGTFISGRKENTPKRSYIFKMGDLEVVGFSPETVVEIDKAGWVSTLPLAGTRAMGKTLSETKALKDTLMQDPKEILEHISTSKFTYEEMKRICIPDTVSVYDFLTVVERGTVQHLASRVVGRKDPSLTSWHVFNGMFPAATSSGAPKEKAIETIGRLENSKRGLYGGCVLTYDYDGALDSALVLRTVFKENEKTWLHVGAGIGPMCDPGFEFQETCDKISSVSKQLVCKSE